MPYIGPPRPPLPPSQLRSRIGQSGEHAYFEAGLNIYNRIKEHVEKYEFLRNFEHVLDWGCGCGRILGRMLDSVEAKSLYGCDIDPDAITWMRQSFPDSSFAHVDPYPPTPFEDHFFDFIYGISVFTHLDESTQFTWLSELRRISRKDGIVAVSVRSKADGRTNSELLDSKGFADREGPKAVLFSHFLPEGYYRLTKHKKAYVLREWSKYFDILEFVEEGLGRQDLVIMRRADD